jgi:predicted PurR-regulated permease PerM
MPAKKDESKIIAFGILRAIGILAALTLVLFILYKLSSVIVYLSVAAVVSLIFRPFNLFLRRRLKFNNTIAVTTSMVIIIFLIIGLFSLMVPLILKESENLSLLNTQEFKTKMEFVITQTDTYLKSHNINILEEAKKIDFTGMARQIPNVLNGVLGTFGNLLMGIVSVLFIAYFFMIDTGLLKKNVLALIPDDKEARIVASYEKIKDLLSRYFIGLILQILILFVLYTILLLIFGIENAVVIALLAAILNLVPYIGPMIAAFIMLTLTMTDNLQLDFQTQILPTTLYVLIGYLIIQFIDNFFSQPFIFSKSTKSHPLEIFLVILVGGILFGILGMVLAVPTYTALKVILKEFLSENEFVRHMTKDI